MQPLHLPCPLTVSPVLTIPGWFQRPSTNIHDVCKAALVKSQTVNNADLVDIHLAFMNMILSEWGALWLGHGSRCYNQGHWHNCKSPAGKKLFPKEVGTRSAVTELRLAAPEVMAWTEVVNSFRSVLVAWLSYSHSLVHTVSTRLKSRHWFASYSCWPATLSPRPDWQTALLEGHSSCRHRHKGDFKTLSILLSLFYHSMRPGVTPKVPLRTQSTWNKGQGWTKRESRSVVVWKKQNTHSY